MSYIKEQLKNPIILENIKVLAKERKLENQKKSPQEKVADLLTKFSGSMLFVYAHTFWFAIWVIFNIGLIGYKPFDPFPFSLLTLIVSLEAIFLSTFVLISQNHSAQSSNKRADLDLQINLLSEQEITKILKVLDTIAKHLDIEIAEKAEVEELKKDVAAEEVLNEIESSN